MARASKISRLPPKIRELVDKLLNHGITLDEIVAELEDLDVKVSRSSLGRYKQKLDAVGERMRRVRELSEAFVQKLGAAPEGKQGRLIMELMQTVIFDVLLAKGEEEDKASAVDPQDVFFLAKAIRDLASAEKISADREIAIRKATAKDAADAATEVARAQGLSKKTIDEFRARILGIAQ